MTPSCRPQAGRLLLIGLLGLCSVRSSHGEGSPIHYPDLSGLEDSVAEQLEEARALLEAEAGGTGPEAAGAAGELGRLWHAYGLEQGARSAYRHAMEQDPGRFDWIYLLAYLEKEAGNLEVATELFREALVMRPEHLPARVRLAEIRLEEGDLEDAEAIVAPILARADSSPSLRALLGRIALAAGRHAEAVEHLEAALRAVPAADRLHYPLALAYRGLGEMDKVRFHLQLRGEIGVRPPDPLVDELVTLVAGERVHLLRGHRAFGAGDYEAAIAAYRAALEARPESVRARVDLGAALGESGDAIGSIELFRSALEVDPGNATAHFNLGRLLLERGDALDALPHLEAAAEEDTSDLESQLLLAEALRRADRGQDAVALYRSVLRDHPGLEDAWLGAASALTDLGRFTAARDSLDEARRTLPASGRIARALAWFLAAVPDPFLRDGERAVGLAEQIFAAQPSPRHAEILAAAHAERGECEVAAEWQERAIELSSSDDARGAELRAGRSRYLSGPPCRLPVGD